MMEGSRRRQGRSDKEDGLGDDVFIWLGVALTWVIKWLAGRELALLGGCEVEKKAQLVLSPIKGASCG